MQQHVKHRLRSLPLAVVAAATMWLGTMAARADSVPAPKTPRLTDRGRLVLSGSVGGSWSNDHSGLYGALKHWSVYGRPSALYFLRDGIGLGLVLSGGASSTRGSYASYRDLDVAFGPEAAFEIALGSRLGLLWRPFVGYLQQWRDEETGELIEDLNSGALTPASRARGVGYVRTWLSLQLLFHLSPSVAIAAGPDVWADFFLFEDEVRSAELSDEPPVRVQVGLSAGVVIAL